eukprot:TRINITY_DN31225_c0_g1_i1.p1 TRINITY_DN31225_c0_g1~~TRINITY_DN31225_c0_g1_i1.p1  ORF type:complete len:188 (-),score=35.68 TRINITY_DN31225_c0_g1_i1:94-657(-)
MPAPFTQTAWRSAAISLTLLCFSRIRGAAAADADSVSFPLVALVGVIGGPVLIAASLVLLLYCCRRRSRQTHDVPSRCTTGDAADVSPALSPSNSELGMGRPRSEADGTDEYDDDFDDYEGDELPTDSDQASLSKPARRRRTKAARLAATPSNSVTPAAATSNGRRVTSSLLWDSHPRTLHSVQTHP